MNKVPVSDTRIKSLDSTALYVAEFLAMYINAHTGDDIKVWFDVMFPHIWRKYLRTQATRARLN